MDRTLKTKKVILILVGLFLTTILLSGAVSAGAITANGTTSYQHAYHKAIKLDDGRVLITNGKVSGSYRGEIFNATDQTWTDLAFIGRGTSFLHSGVELLPNGNVSFIGGRDTGNVYFYTYMNDPDGLYSYMGDINLARYKHHLWRLPGSGNMLVFGGVDAAGDGLKNNELYLLSNGSWNLSASDVINVRWGLSGAATWGPEAELYTDRDSGASLFKTVPIMFAGRDYPPLVSEWTTKSFYFWNPTSYVWHTFTPTGSNAWSGAEDLTATACAANAGATKYILTTGGWHEGSGPDYAVADTLKLEVGSINFSVGPYTAGANVTKTDDLNWNRTLHAAANGLDYDEVVVFGGWNGLATVSETIEVYDCGTDTWSFNPTNMTKPRYGHSATRLDDGTVLIVGGYAGPSETSPQATWEIYDPTA